MNHNDCKLRQRMESVSSLVKPKLLYPNLEKVLTASFDKKRSSLFLAAQCENGLEYKACGSACAETCETQCGAHPSCPIPCTEGCHCPNGTVLHSGACIEPQACPCVVNGQEYKNGSFVISNCQNW